MPVKFMRKVPFEAFGIVLFLVAMNVVVWAVCLGVLVSRIGKVEHSRESGAYDIPYSIFLVQHKHTYVTNMLSRSVHSFSQA